MKPNERDPAIDRLVRGLEPPQPPTDLRTKVLAAARRSMVDQPTRDIWSAVWNSRGVRAAWAAAVMLLLAGHAMVAPGKGDAFRSVEPALIAENSVDNYLAEMFRPARISDNALPIVGLVASANGLTELEIEGNPS